MTTGEQFLYNEIIGIRCDLLELKRKSLAFENSALREKIKRNTAMRRDMKRQIHEIRKQIQPDLPF